MLTLQKANLISNLDEQGAQDGFLSMEYTERQFDEINRDLGIAVAVQGEELLGYACAASFSYARQFPLIAELIANLEGRSLQGQPLSQETAFIYGPVCITRQARGAGVLGRLFEAVKELARQRYAICVLFISDRNQRSLHAHIRKLGMKDLGAFEFNQKLFHIVGALLD